MMSHMKGFTRVVALVLASTMALGSGGCGKRSADDASGSATAAATATFTTKDVDMSTVAAKSDNDLVVGTQSDTTTLDPIEAGNSAAVEVLLPTLEQLVRYDADGNLQPWLAESWEVVDSQTFKFNLRKGVKFHNGEEMKASDVVYSFKRATGKGAENVAYIMGMVDPDGLEAVDDYTVIIRTKVPFGAFVNYMPYIGASIVSQKAYENNPDASTHPVGTGPYEFVSYTKGEGTKYKAFDDYWGGKPDCDSLTIKPIPDVTTRYTALETGEIDIATGLTVNEATQIEDNSDLNLSTAATTVFSTLNFNCEKAPFNNKTFRQAIDYAIDSNGIVDSVFRGTAQYTPGPVTPNTKYFDSSASDNYDPEKAKELLKESGADLSKTYEIAVSENKNYIDEATIIQQQLADVGVKVEIKQMEYATYNEYITGTDKDMFFSGWGAVGFPDPDNNLYGPLHSSGIPNNNTTYTDDSKLDSLLDKERSLADGDEREETCIEAQQYIKDLTPYITIANPINIVGYRNYVQGFRALAPTDQYFNNVSLKHE